jgi:hypothetical protein
MSDRTRIRLSTVISIAALAFAVIVLVSRHDPRSNTTSASPPVPAAGTQAPPVAAVAPARPAQPAQPAQPADTSFWRLTDGTRRAAGDDTGRRSELLKDRLTQLTPQAIVDFARTRHRLDQSLYTWSMWGAATVIEDGCSDDCFRDFRAYVISLGRGAYERALRNPDSLASVAQDAESGDWENADNVAPDAYSSVTGHDFPLDDSDLSGRLGGTPVSMSEAALRQRYPRLASRFRRG